MDRGAVVGGRAPPRFSCALGDTSGGVGGSGRRGSGRLVARVRAVSPATGRWTCRPPVDRAAASGWRLQPVARRPASGVRRGTRQLSTLDPAAGCAGRASAGRNRRSRVSVLVARQPVHRVRRRREAQESRRIGRRRSDAVRRASGHRRHVESRRRDSVRSQQPDATVSRSGRRRPTGPGDRARSIARPEHTPLSLFSPRRPALSLPRAQQPQRGESGIYAGTLDSTASRRIVAAIRRSHASPGYLFFVRGRALLQRFDAGALRITGDAVQVAEDVRWQRRQLRGLLGVRARRSCLPDQRRLRVPRSPGSHAGRARFDIPGRRATSLSRRSHTTANVLR